MEPGRWPFPKPVSKSELPDERARAFAVDGGGNRYGDLSRNVGTAHRTQVPPKEGHPTEGRAPASPHFLRGSSPFPFERHKELVGLFGGHAT